MNMVKYLYVSISLVSILISFECLATEIVLSCDVSMTGSINGKKSHADNSKFGLEISDTNGVVQVRAFGNLAFIIGGEEWKIKHGSCVSDTYPVCNGSITIGEADILIREEMHQKWAKDKSSNTYHDARETEISINRYTGTLDWKIYEADWSVSPSTSALTRISGNCIPENKRKF
jgi:hypothetical protein